MRDFKRLAHAVWECKYHIVWCPKYSVSEVVGFLKGKSAIKIFDTYLELKKRHWGRHFWAKG